MARDGIGERGAVAAADEHVGPAGDERCEVLHEHPDVEQRTRVQVTMSRAHAHVGTHHGCLRHDRTVGEHRRVGSTAEGRSRDDEDGIVGGYGGTRCRPVGCGRNERLVGIGTVDIVHDHTRGGVVRGRDPGTRRCSDLFVLVDDHDGSEVVDDERQLVGLLAPVRRTQHRAQSRAREQELLDAEAVLTEPQHPLTPYDTRGGERCRALVDAPAELLPAQRELAVGDRERTGSHADVLVEHIGQRRATRDHR